MCILMRLSTVRQFLLECDNLAQMRYKYFYANNTKQLLKFISVDKSMIFLKNINLYNKI